MSDISTDFESILKEMEGKYPQQCKLFPDGATSVKSSDVDVLCSVKSTGEAMIYWFRDLREKWYASNREITRLEQQLAEAKQSQQWQPTVLDYIKLLEIAYENTEDAKNEYHSNYCSGSVTLPRHEEGYKTYTQELEFIQGLIDAQSEAPEKEDG